MPNPALVCTPIAATLTTDTAAPLLTVPAGEERSVSVRVTNYSVADSTVSIWMVPSGEVLADKHRRLASWPLAKNVTEDPEIALAMSPGVKLYVAAGAANSISCSITGTRSAI